jgi:hypothetical protein
VLERQVTPAGNPFRVPVVRGCVAKHRFAYPVHHPKGFGRIISAYLYLNGKLFKTLTSHNLGSASIAKPPKGRFKVTVKALTTKRLAVVSTRSYKRC